jgi:glycosyltransferase involved in cell wall biosynthesis
MDVQLVRHLRGRSGFLIGTRPALNFIAAELAPPGTIAIGEEQMHLRHHVKPLRLAMRELYPRLDKLVVLTETDRERYAKHLGRRHAAKLAVIPNTARQMGGPKADLSATRVLAAGRLTRQKGFDVLVDAWAEVADAHPDWTLRICGKGHLRNALRRQVRQRDVGASVELPGPRDLEVEMAEASIFVLSSRFEGFPLVLLEAMSKGMAVVAADCPTGPRDVIRDRENGLLVPMNDPEALAEGIRTFMNDPELRRRCGEAAVETAREYSIDAVGPRWEALFDELAGTRRPAGEPVGAPVAGR